MKIKSFKNLKLKFKIIIPLLSVMLFLFAAIVIITIYSLKKTSDYNTDNLIKTKINGINNTIEQVSNKALYIASISSEMKIVKDAYEEYYSTKNLKQASYIIESQFEEINKTIIKNTGYEPRIHFHLPPAISFCRCWSEVRGDDISSFRNSVLQVSQDHNSVKGIETGRGGFVIRGIAPIFSSTGEYYGSVEAFFNINHLVKEINRNTKEEFAIFINNDLLKIATDFLEKNSSNINAGKQIPGNYVLVEKTKDFKIENLLKYKLVINKFENNIFEFNDYKYAVIPILNITGESEGIGILQIDISDYNQSLNSIILFELLLFLILIIVVIVLLSSLSNRFILRKIQSTNTALQKLAKGEITEKIAVIHNDEISNMQKSLNTLNETITKNTDFAKEIGKGNFTTEYKTISEKDLLGNAITKMQERLIRYTEETKHALNASIKSEEKFKQLSNLTFEGILIHEKGIAIDTNLSFSRMFGYKQEELAGKNIIELVIQKKYHKIISENIIKNHALPYEIEGIKKDGSIFPIEIEARNFDIIENEKIIRVTAIRDISIRKKTEQEIKKLSIAVEQSANTIVITDLNGNIEYVNKKFTELTGYTAEEAIGQNPRILNSGTQPKKYYTHMWKTITEGKIWKGEFHNKKKNGNFFWELVTITPLKNDTEKITNYLAIKEDITARKESENELILSKEKAEESDRLKTEFINNMSHEIRTPMNGILGFSQFLSKPDLSKKKMENFINIIQSSGKQLLRIIDDILEISKLGTKQVKAIEADVCINDLLFGLFSIFDIKAKENDIHLYLKKDLSDTQSHIYTDRSKLVKILSNLLENALKFTNTGFIEFGYKLKETKIEFYVKDTGIGIKGKSQKTIFERFSQEEKELSQHVGGLGLGLSIAKENAELLGGTITLESTKGEGSIFYISIPYKPVIQDNKNSDLIKNHIKRTHDKKCTLLIVEDEEVNYLYLETLLQDEIEIALDCTLIHAKNGHEAVTICKKTNIDFILMDIKMPIMNGYEATKLIKEIKPNIPIVAQTAYSSPEHIEEARLAGCDDFISKPINQKNLTAILNKYLSLL